MMMNLNARGEDSSERGQSSGNMFTDRQGQVGSKTAHHTNRRDLEQGSRAAGVNITKDTVTRVDREDDIELSPAMMRRAGGGGGGEKDMDLDFGRAGVVDQIPYQESNHRDEWSESPDQHSQVELVRNASYNKDRIRA